MEGIFLLILFVIGSLLKSAAEKKQREQAERELGAGESPEQDDLMEEIRRAMEEMRRQRAPEPPPPTPARGPLATVERDDDGFDEEDESLEEEPVVRSLEEEVRRPTRTPVSYDRVSEVAVEERIRWAEERARAMQPADHRAFDQRIRAPEPAAAALEGVARPGVDRTTLQQMLVWQEILGKPLALRDRDRT